MINSTPNYDEINKIEAEILRSRWEAIRFAIEHQGEKGAAAEQEVFSLIRSLLPNEYGMTTGFITYHENDNFLRAENHSSPRITKQLDIIIYDAIKCTPLIRLGSCDVVPIEAVYGYIEIKGCLYQNKIHDLIDDSNTLRSLKRRYFYRSKGNTGAELVYTDENSLSIRSFIICLSSEDSLNSERIRDLLEKESRQIANNAFISGMLVLDKGFFYSHSVSMEKIDDKKNQFKVYKKETNPLGYFKWCMVESLSRFHRIPLNLTPALDTYSKEYKPEYEEPRASCMSSINTFQEDKDL